MLKDHVVHKANAFYKGTCSGSKLYVGEAKRNTEVRWKEHCSPKKTSEVGEYWLMNAGHTVNWEILTNAPKQVNKQKILDVFYIRTLQPTRNNKLNTKGILIFRNGIT